MATTTPVSIQLATFPHSHSQSPDDLSPTSQKAFPLDVFPVSEPISAPPSYSRQSPAPRRWSWQLPDADKVETVLWAAVPLVFYAIAFALALGLLVSQAEGYAFLSVVEKNGSERLDYYIMSAFASGPFVRPEELTLPPCRRLLDHARLDEASMRLPCRLG